MTAARRLRLAYLAVTTAIVIADQVVKHLIDRGMELHTSRPIISGLVQLTYVRNRGGAFGLLSSADFPLQNALFCLLSAIAFVVILVIALRLPASRLGLQAPLSLVMGGAIGNLIDRLRFGYVIDFVDVFWKSYHWPMFNVADSAISVGVCLLLLDMLREPRPAEASTATPADASAALRRT